MPRNRFECKRRGCNCLLPEENLFCCRACCEAPLGQYACDLNSPPRHDKTEHVEQDPDTDVISQKYPPGAAASSGGAGAVGAGGSASDLENEQDNNNHDDNNSASQNNSNSNHHETASTGGGAAVATPPPVPPAVPCAVPPPVPPGFSPGGGGSLRPPGAPPPPPPPVPGSPSGSASPLPSTALNNNSNITTTRSRLLSGVPQVFDCHRRGCNCKVDRDNCYCCAGCARGPGVFCDVRNPPQHGPNDAVQHDPALAASLNSSVSSMNHSNLSLHQNHNQNQINNQKRNNNPHVIQNRPAAPMVPGMTASGGDAGAGARAGPQDGTPGQDDRQQQQQNNNLLPHQQREIARENKAQGGMELARVRLICCAQLNGGCQLSEADCGFSHDTTTDRSASRPCQFGDKCRYDHHKRAWVPNDNRTHCNTCGKEFGFFTRKHHCRNCGDLCCADCHIPAEPIGKVCRLCLRVLIQSGFDEIDDFEIEEVLELEAARQDANINQMSRAIGPQRGNNNKNNQQQHERVANNQQPLEQPIIPPGGGERVDEGNTSEGQWRLRVYRMYQHYQPDKVDNVDNLLDVARNPRYQNRQYLMECLVNRYGPEPTDEQINGGGGGGAGGGAGGGGNNQFSAENELDEALMITNPGAGNQNRPPAHTVG